MNDGRRKVIGKVSALLNDARALLEGVAEEEQEAFDNLTEGLQASERGERMQEVAFELESLASELEGIEERLEECKA